jgi:Zn-dependent protease with chaperone function
VASATFFEQQHLARRNTRVMIALFLLAVVAVVLAVNLVGVVAWFWIFEPPRGTPLAKLPGLIPPTFFLWVSAITATMIFLVSVIHVSKLASGGKAVAEMVGARRVSPDTRDPLERRLVNIVEEMAIASGVRVPGVYIMDGEPGINAFAAGWDVSGAVVAVTRGTLETLTRDEVQGVVAHEFSHILNGDMRLNIRMMGVLAGILFVSSVGEFLMRSQRSRNRSSDSGDSRIALIGLGLFIVGYVGLFFGRLIKAAVSRQREFLADASSVQFTRNPDGIAGALDQIGAASEGALIENRYAEDMSHMFFGQGIRVWASGLFDTHPPIEERIRRVHPGFQRTSYRGKRPPQETAPAPSAEGFGHAAVSGFSGTPQAIQQAGRRPTDIGSEWGRSAGDSAKMVGTLNPSKIDFAARLVAALPAALKDSLRDPDGSRAALVALLLAPKADVMQQQLEAVAAAGAGALAERAKAVAPLTARLGAGFHLPVIDLALPAIKAAPEAAQKEFLAALEAAVNADRRVSLHEFVVLTLVRHQLAPKTRPPAQSGKLADMRAEAGIVLSLIAHAGRRPDATGARKDELERALRAGAKEMGLGEEAPAVTLTLPAASAALEALKRLAPLQKALLVKSLFATATLDGSINVAEAELLRLVGAVLDCPLPPLLDEIDPASLAA